MSRPLDYGDEFPSDIDDLLPADPTDNFNEVDYVVSSSVNNKRSTKARSDPRLVVPTTLEQTPEKRSTWYGVITKAAPAGVFPRVYTVLRQDGMRGIARVNGNEGVFHEYRIGDPVTLTTGQINGEFAIVGAPRQHVLPLLQLRIDEQKLPTDIAFEVNFKELDLSIGTDDEDGPFLQKDNGIQLKTTNPKTLCEISFTLNIASNSLTAYRDLRGKLNATLSAGGQASMTVWHGSAASEEVVTVYDWLLKSGQSLPSGREVFARYFADSKKYYVYAAKCG